MTVYTNNRNPQSIEDSLKLAIREEEIVRRCTRLTGNKLPGSAYVCVFRSPLR